MHPPVLQVNELIQVRVVEGEFRDSYPSRIEDVRGDEVVIAWPTDKGILLPIVPDQTLQVSYVHDGKYYGFEGIVRETALTPLPSVVLHVPTRPDRIERRDNVRVNAAVPVELTEKVVSLSEYRESGEENVIRTVTVNISGGGFAIRHGTFIPVGTVFDANLTLPDKKGPVSIAAKVVRCTESGGEGQNLLGFSYLQISEKLRSRIVRFVFAAQISEMHPAE